MRRIVKAIYWRIISVIARMSRSVEALNEGFAPQGSLSTGPHQPMSALRDAVALLGVSTNRLESRLESIAVTTTNVVDRLVYSLVLAEVSSLPAESKIVVVGDSIAVKIASDLADLSYDVVLHDTDATTGLELSSWVGRASSGDSLESGQTDVIVVATSVPLERLARTVTDAIDVVIAERPASSIVFCSPVPSEDAATSALRWRAGAGDFCSTTRAVNSAGQVPGTRRVTAVTIASQLGR